MMNSKTIRTALVALLWLVLVCLAAGSGELSAQCIGGVENAAIEASTPTEQFRPQADGTVLHLPTRLVWQRCALGQSWTGTDCSGTAQSFDWAGALIAARDHQQASQDDWRLPNRNELESIVETRCHSPAINGEIFPATPVEWFWTGSPVSGSTDQVWVVLFGDGDLQPAVESGQHPVRLVRAGRN